MQLSKCKVSDYFRKKTSLFFEGWILIVVQCSKKSHLNFLDKKGVTDNLVTFHNTA